MNMFVIGSCYYQKVVLVNPITGEPIPASKKGYGFRSREISYGETPDYRQCLYYPEAEYEDIFDGWMRAAKAFSFLSSLLGLFGFCVMVLACCFAFSPAMWERWLLWSYIFAGICIALSFLTFGSEFCDQNDCKVAQGGGWAISALLFWCVCANTVKSMPHALPKADYDSDYEDSEGDDYYYEDEKGRPVVRRRQQEQPGQEGIRDPYADNYPYEDDYPYGDDYPDQVQVQDPYGEEQASDYNDEHPNEQLFAIDDEDGNANDNDGYLGGAYQDEDNQVTADQDDDFLGGNYQGEDKEEDNDGYLGGSYEGGDQNDTYLGGTQDDEYDAGMQEVDLLGDDPDGPDDEYLAGTQEGNLMGNDPDGPDDEYLAGTHEVNLMGDDPNGPDDEYLAGTHKGNLMGDDPDGPDDEYLGGARAPRVGDEDGPTIT